MSGFITGGGGGGGGGTDPNAVQKTGDTMTGPLESPAFYFNPGGPGGLPTTSALLYQNSADSYLWLMNSTGFRLQSNVSSTAPAVVFNNGTTNVYTKLQIDQNGDLIAVSWIGPNAGKSVNLTAGKWA